MQHFKTTMDEYGTIDITHMEKIVQRKQGRRALRQEKYIEDDYEDYFI